MISIRDVDNPVREGVPRAVLWYIEEAGQQPVTIGVWQV